MCLLSVVTLHLDDCPGLGRTLRSVQPHLGPADFYVLSGVMESRGGVSRAGDWIYEPNGAVHEATHHPEETIYLPNVHGAIAFTGEDGQIVGISDWRAMKALQEAQG